MGTKNAALIEELLNTTTEEDKRHDHGGLSGETSERRKNRMIERKCH